jgi:integrase/recombinase XerD
MINESSAHINARITLPPALQAWEIFLVDQGNSPHTITAFLGDLRLLASYLPPDRQVGEINLADLNNFLRWMQHERDVPCSPKTLARRITSLKSFFRWLHEGGAIPSNPSEKVVQKSVRSPLPEVLDQNEIDQILETAQHYRVKPDPDYRSYLLFKLLLETGIKKGECLSLSPNHIQMDAPEGPIVFIRYASPKNRYKERKLLLSDEWIDAYQEYRSHHTLVDRLFPWSARMLEYILEDLGKDAGITKRVSFSMCRWTAAVLDWKSGMEPNKIRQKLGISEVQWREVSRKLHTLSRDNTEVDDSPDEPIESGKENL